MRIAIIGLGPAGLFIGAGLARRGHQVVAVERDPGPADGGRWARRGVMQFHHAHGFRTQVVQALEQELPEALQRWLDAGGEPITLTLPGGAQMPMGMRSRRETFERALRAAALEQPGLEVRQGHADRVRQRGGRAAGLEVDGAGIAADLVIDASGRAGRVTRSLRPAVTSGGPCGIAYVDRQYQLRPGAEPGPLANPLAWQADLDGYQAIIFVHERGRFSVLLVRPAGDQVLARLRHEAAFTAASRAIPGLSDWVDPARARPVSPVLPGGPLFNAYRPQTGPDGGLALPGLVFAGDAVATTTPTFGRGVTTTLLQAQQLLRLIDEHGTDVAAVGESFDAWCTEQIKPWVDDHVLMDDATQRRWAGQDIDLSQPLSSDLLLAAAASEPDLAPATFGYLGMTALPAALRAVEARARARYAGGWRAPVAPGPSRDELAAIIEAALRGAPESAPELTPA
jgi:2-polyprenyl-6-methoxyphenol hydroxylase-like FAD-dependent oxidoreductase